MWKRIKRIIINGMSAHLVSKEMSHEDLLRTMQEKKDVHLTTFADGRIIGTCNPCNTEVHIVQQDGLVWYLCPKCSMTSFNPVENLTRDIEIANRYGGMLEHEIYYFRDLPTDLKIPKMH